MSIHCNYMTGLEDRTILHRSVEQYLATPLVRTIRLKNEFMNIWSSFHLSDNTEYVGKGEVGYDTHKKLGTLFMSGQVIYRDVDTT